MLFCLIINKLCKISVLAVQAVLKLRILRVKRILPKKGKIGILYITDKQFGSMELFIGKDSSPLPQVEQQLELF